PDDFRVGKALDQQFRRIAGPAAEIDHASGLFERYLRQEIARRTGTLILELEVLLGAPVAGRAIAGGGGHFEFVSCSDGWGRIHIHAARWAAKLAWRLDCALGAEP